MSENGSNGIKLRVMDLLKVVLFAASAYAGTQVTATELKERIKVLESRGAPAQEQQINAINERLAVIETELRSIKRVLERRASK